MDDYFTFEITIPSDADGYILLQCEYCGELFKCKTDDIESDSVLYIHCPCCGLISDNYWTEDVIELTNTIAGNYVEDYIYDSLGEIAKDLNRNKGVLKMELGKKHKHEYESPIYSRIIGLRETLFKCCERSARISTLLRMSVSHCPFCGGVQFANWKN